MKRRILGGTGISVSEYALGTMMLSASGNADHDDVLDRIDELVPPGTDINSSDIDYAPPSLTDRGCAAADGG